MNDIRQALRRLRATPLVTLSAIACLATGIWISSIMTALGRGFFRPNLGIPNSERVVQLEPRGLFALNPYRSAVCCGRRSSQAVVDSLTNHPAFAAVGTYDFGSISLDDKLRKGSWLSAGMMTVLHARPFFGRTFVPADDTTNDVVILSHHLWRTMYGGDSTVVGRRLFLRRDPRPYTIVGVMRSDFMFPKNELRPDLYFPAQQPRAGRPPYPAVRMLARLADGVSLNDVREDVAGLVVRNARADRDAVTHYWRTSRRGASPPELPDGPVDVRLERYYNEPLEPDAVRLMILILACGFAVVAIAGANVVNLLLVRGAARRQEIAVRMALGAARMRILRELLVETGLVAAVGVILGFLAAAWQWSRIDDGFAARHLFGEIDTSVAVAAVIAGFVMSLAVGVWPGLRATSMGLDQVLRDSRRSGFGTSPLDGLLGRMVAAATAGTVMLLICAVLLSLSARDSAREWGFGGRNLFTADLMFQQESPSGRTATGREALTRMRSLPDVAAAAIGVAPPNGAAETLLIGIDGQPEVRFPAVSFSPVSDGFFKTLAIPLIYGREFSPRDTRDSSRAVMLNRSLAERLFPGRTALGARFHYRRVADSTRVDATVIGVVEDVRGGTGGGRPAQLYLSLASSPPMQTSAHLRLKTARRPDLITALRPVDNLVTTPLQSVAERSRGIEAGRRYLTIGFMMFAGVSLLLAAVGTYGIVAYSVVRRTHEIGVRMALGARRGRVMWMIVEQGLTVTLIGLIGGLLLAFAATRMLGAFIQDVSMDYPLAIGAVVVFIALISLIATGVPAYRAGRLSPVDALRAE